MPTIPEGERPNGRGARMRVAGAIVVMLHLQACTSPLLTTVDQSSVDAGRAGTSAHAQVGGWRPPRLLGGVRCEHPLL